MSSGRVHTVRSAGSKLVFLDLKQGNHTVQAICQSGKFDQNVPAQELSNFKAFAKLVRKGDWYEVVGYPHRSPRGELSVLAYAIPKLLSPSLHQIPPTLEDPETRARSRHVEMLVNPVAIQTLRVRHLVEQSLASFFNEAGFTRVTTPILSAGAGGAIARPFETEATELEGQTLNLRIAPELWLKRLVVGGMEKVYEIGPSFRNEGVDATHNPEFTTCEFYEAFATLDDLIDKTQNLLQHIAANVESELTTRLHALEPPPIDKWSPFPFQRLEFIPTLERCIGRPLPDLFSDPTRAQQQILTIFQDLDLALPTKATLPNLLDALASHFLEPLCEQPTFITHHPACLSPLSLHFDCPTTGQRVAARAELFIKGREYANMYEEENSPFEQRRKFEEQLRYRSADGEEAEGGEGGGEKGSGGIDESYLEALEWGLPPTGGWGCGVDRLVMLFAGRERISDVLAFGTVRNVVGLAGRRRKV